MSLWNMVTATIEYREWGVNFITCSFLMTVALTFALQLPGLSGQAWTVWRNRSGDGVSVPTCLALCAYFGVFFVYANNIGSGAAMLNAAVLAFPSLWLLVGVYRFKGFSFLEWLLAGVVIAVIVATIVLSSKYLIYMAVSFATAFGLISQVVELWRTRITDNVNQYFLALFSGVSCIWVAYALLIGDWVMAVMAGMFALLYGLILLSWMIIRYQ